MLNINITALSQQRKGHRSLNEKDTGADTFESLVSPGMRLLERIMRSEGFDAQIAGPKYGEDLFASAPDAWFVSCLSIRQYFDIAEFFQRLGLEPLACDRSDDDPLIAMGGSLAFINPAPVWRFFDVVAVGDGEVTGPALARLYQEKGRRGTMESLLEHPLPGLMSTLGPIACDAAKVSVFEPREVLMPNKRSVIEVARSCRRKCAYCSIGWSGEYREAEREQVEALVKASKNKTLNMFAPSMSDVSWHRCIGDMMSLYGKNDSGQDTSIKSYLNNDVMWRKSLVCGIDGASERIRKACGKPLDDDEILAAIGKAIGNGVTRIKFHQLLGLPGETEADLETWISLWDKILGLVLSDPKLQIILNIQYHVHTPHTPLEDEPLVDQDAARRCATTTKAMAVEVNKKRYSAAVVLQPKSEGLWGVEQHFMFGDDLAEPLLDWDLSKDAIRKCKWVDRVGPAPTGKPWQDIRSGLSTSRKAKALANYRRIMGM